MAFTLLLDRLMVGWKEPIRYWPPTEMVELLESRLFPIVRQRERPRPTLPTSWHTA